jgi:hypothetical protein
MDGEVKECPKCRGQLVRGFIPDYSHAAILVGRWHEGTPRKSFFGWWRCMKAPKSDGLPVGVYRCSTCGYLEFYAGSEYGAS